MSLPEDLAGFSREELIELVGRLFGHIQVLEARIAELEGQQKPPTDAGKGAEAAVLGQGQPARPLQGRTAEAAPRLWPETGGAHPPGGTRHGQLPRLPGSSDRQEGVRKPPGDYPASGTGRRVTEHVVLERACPKCRKRWAPEPDWGALSVGRQRFGVSVQSEVSMLREECRLPFRVIQRYLKWRFGLRLSVGELVDLVRGRRSAAKRNTPGYAKRFEPARWCTGTKRAGVKMAVMATSGASALPRCATSSTGRPEQEGGGGGVGG